MRKRICLLILAAAAATALLLPALAQGTVYFTAINNTLLSLEDKTMPVKHKSMIYVPCSVFNSSELGTYSLYSRGKQLVVISDLNKTLYFSMSEGNSYDEQGETFPYAAIYQNDTAYVPALFTADYFGASYSYINSSYGPIIRLTKGDVLSDEAFLRGAAAIMETRLAQYQAAQESASAAPSASPPVTTGNPTNTPRPTSTPLPTASPRPNRSGVEVYIAVLGLSENSESCAALLQSRGYTACYFVRAEDILERPELIRRLYGQGCGVGILFHENLEEEYGYAARLLRKAVHTVTFLAAAEQELEGEELEAAEETGLKLWCAQTPLMDAESGIVRLASAEQRCDLILSGAMEREQMAAIIDYLQAESYTVKLITELMDTAFGNNG